MWSDLIYSGYVRQQVAAVMLMRFAGFCNVVKSCVICADFSHPPPASVSIRCCHGYLRQATGTPLFPSLHLITQFVILADLISRMSQILLVSCSLSATLSELDGITVSLFLLPVLLFLFSFSGLVLSPHHHLHYTSLLLFISFSVLTFLHGLRLSLVTWLTGSMVTDAYTGPLHSGTLSIITDNRNEAHGTSMCIIVTRLYKQPHGNRLSKSLLYRCAVAYSVVCLEVCVRLIKRV